MNHPLQKPKRRVFQISKDNLFQNNLYVPPDRLATSTTHLQGHMTANIKFNTDMTFAYGEPAGMAPGITRIVANNPSPFTFKGTNTYLVGSKSLAVIDPGPDDKAHRDAILTAAAGRPITHIFLTHTHRDHSDGLAKLKQATGSKSFGYNRKNAPGPEKTQLAPSGRAFIDFEFQPEIELHDGDVISGDDWQLEALHTPGHAPDHVCFAEQRSNVLFSGDHVMSWNTTVIAPPEGRMSDYVASLERLIEQPASVFLPGHGGRIRDPSRTVRAYLLHRQWREQNVLEALKSGCDTINKIMPEVYRSIDKSLAVAATLSVQAHVEHLIELGMLMPVDSLAFDTPLQLVKLNTV